MPCLGPSEDELLDEERARRIARETARLQKKHEKELRDLAGKLGYAVSLKKPRRS